MSSCNGPNMESGGSEVGREGNGRSKMTQKIKHHKINPPKLETGSHPDGKKVCLMEWVDLLSRGKNKVSGPVTDSPPCTDVSTAAMARSANDFLDDDSRQLLLELVPVLLADSPSADISRHARRAAKSAELAKKWAAITPRPKGTELARILIDGIKQLAAVK